MNKNLKQITPQAFQLKGSLFTLTILQLLQDSLDNFIKQLKITVSKTPNFFRNAPVLVDLNKLINPEAVIDFPRMNMELRQHGLIPVGILGGNTAQQASAASAGLGILTNNNTEKPAITSPSPTNHPARLITKPIRSGQQVYAQHSDLIVLAPVSSGAELLADGHIHVYNTLRGRALAGVCGNKEARIFCHKLEADLVSIAGYYKLNEDIQPINGADFTQVYLENDHLKISGL